MSKKLISTPLILIVVFVFSGFINDANATGVETISHLNLTGTQDGEEFGYPVRFVGDVNNDGTEDVAIGALGYDIGSIEDVGRVLIYSGTDIGGDSVPDLIREHTQPFTTTASESAFFGAAIVRMGDVNSDNFDDYAIMDPRFSTGEGGAIHNERGRVIAYSGQDGSTLWVYTGTEDFQLQFGNAQMVSARDFSSDGIRDIALGAPGLNGRTGAILILNATTGALITQYNGNTDNRNMLTGISFATGFDINNDSVEDFIVGEQFTTITNLKQGGARVISGSDFSTIYTVSAPVVSRFGFFGIFVQLTGDVNNDTRNDFAISSREDVGGFRQVGALRQFSGVTAGVLSSYFGNEKGELFGSSLASPGDINNDGYDDIVSAGLAASNGAGRADIYQSKGAIKWDKFPGGAAGEAVGSDIDAGRDINGDGVPDMILGSTGGQSGSIFPGRTRVVRSIPGHAPTGSTIEIHPEVGKQDTTVTFSTITTDGNITLTYNPGSGATFRTKQGNNTEEWTIITDAVHSGIITVCLKYDVAVGGYTNENNIVIQHFEGADFENAVNQSLDTANDIVCGDVTSL